MPGWLPKQLTHKPESSEIAIYLFGILFLIYFPIRLIHCLITKKPVASWEKYFLTLTLIFVVPFAIISNFFLN